jgi:hypothetical protein
MALREVRVSEREADKFFQEESAMDLVVRTPWFRECAEFFYRTTSPAGKMYDSSILDVSHGSPGEVLRSVANSAFAFTQQWSEEYRHAGRGHLTASLWTGNLTDAFIMLADAENFLDTEESRLLKPRINDADYFWTKYDLELEEDDRASIDHADKGGIDLAAGRIDLQTTGGGEAIRLNIDPVRWQAYQAAPGFVPVIIGTRSMDDLGKFLNTR